VESSTTTVLDCDGDLQESGRAFEERSAYYETGDALFFAGEDVSSVEIGDDATVNGRPASVAEVMPIDDSLMLTFDG